MANKHLPHKGAGSAVFKACMDWALEHGAQRLFILSNSKRKPALHIYEKFGFQEIKLEIETIYIDGNASSHFDTIKDSYRVYKEILNSDGRTDESAGLYHAEIQNSYEI